MPVLLTRQRRRTGEAEFDPENASASHRVDPSSPSEFRLSSLFGRESEPVEKQEQPATPVQTAEQEPVHRETAELDRVTRGSHFEPQQQLLQST